MGESGAQQIVDVPHAFGYGRRGEQPSATQATESIGFGEAVGNDETLWIDMEGGLRFLFKEHFAVDLIYHDISVVPAGKSGDITQHRVGDECSAGVVQVGNDNGAGARGELTLKVGQIKSEIFLCGAGKAPDGQSEILSYIQDRSIRRLLNQALVTGSGDGGQREIVGKRGAHGADNGFLRHGI